ncbi:MAG: hypothetical protein H7301_02530 [Cryobacterium sp.]|nr:hypothetical protein [Oligoflexia bacterium]
MAWYERHASDLERLEFSRLAELYALLKRWKESVPDLSWKPVHEFEAKLANDTFELDDFLYEETGAEMVATLKQILRTLLMDWESVFATLREKRSPLLSRALRLAEEEALRYSSTQWKDRSDDRFPSLGPVFAAYRETPFYTLYRDQLVIIRQTASELLFFTQHPVLDLESAWMRGFVSALRPSVHVEPYDFGDRMAFAWREIRA